MKRVLTFVILWFLLITCQKQPYTNEIFIPRDIVIAHRGTTYWAPEETEMAYRWARNIGAHYLEADIQRSKDGVLLALHDDKLTRTTNIEEIFPDRIHESSSQFSFEELLQLDAGSWFGNDCMSCSKDYYFSQNKLVETTQDPIFFDEDGNANSEILNQTIFIGGGQGISTLEDVIRIAEGYRIAKDSIGKRIYKKIEIEGSVEYIFYYVKDMDDGGHRPGVYLETKEPHLFPNIEQDLFNPESKSYA